MGLYDKLKIQIQSFADLNADEIYGILRLRQDIFVIEQACLYPDIDDLDQAAVHAFWRERESGKIITCCRVVLPTKDIPYAKFGRFCCAKEYRGQDLGKTLCEKVLHYWQQLYPDIPLCLEGQAYLRAFYLERGFRMLSEEYLEDGIPHILFISGPQVKDLYREDSRIRTGRTFTKDDLEIPEAGSPLTVFYQTHEKEKLLAAYNKVKSSHPSLVFSASFFNLSGRIEHLASTCGENHPLLHRYLFTEVTSPVIPT